MVPGEVIQERLRLLAEYVEDLKAEQGISFDQYRGDKKTRRYVEHTLQIAIECCLDIGHHIIAAQRLPLPKEQREIFQVLSDAGILSNELLPTLQKMVGFRNRLVHEYERVEDDFVYGVLEKNIGDLVLFGQAIRKYLETMTSTRQGHTSSDSAGRKTLQERQGVYAARRKRKIAR